MKKLVQLWRESLTLESRSTYEQDIMSLAIKHQAAKTFKTWLAWWKADSREQRSWLRLRGFVALGLRGNLSESANAKNKHEGCVSLIERVRIFGSEQLAECAAAKHGASLGVGPNRHDLELRQAALVGRTTHQELIFIFNNEAPTAAGAGAGAAEGAPPASVVTAYDSFRSTAPKTGKKGASRIRNGIGVNTRTSSTVQLNHSIELASKALRSGQHIVASKIIYVTTGAGAGGATTAVSGVEFEVSSSTNSDVVYTCLIAMEPTCTCPAWLETGPSFICFRNRLARRSMTTGALHVPTDAAEFSMQVASKCAIICC
jgi:hypothetical protein